jgi:SAM-dependent methyltransferase
VSLEFDSAVQPNVKMALDFAVLANNYTIRDLISYIRMSLEDPFDAKFYSTENESKFDQTYGTKTALIFEQFALPEQISMERFKNSGRYIPTPINAIEATLRGIGTYIDYNDFTFIDIGSGLGRNLLLASEYDFKKIVGVEISSFLTEQAQENIRIYKSPGQKCSSIDAVCVDALKYAFPEGNMVIYIWEPFNEALFEQFMANLLNHIEDRNVSVLFAILGQKYSGSPGLSRFRYLTMFRTSGLIGGYAHDYLKIGLYANNAPSRSIQVSA